MAFRTGFFFCFFLSAGWSTVFATTLCFDLRLRARFFCWLFHFCDRVIRIRGFTCFCLNCHPASFIFAAGFGTCGCFFLLRAGFFGGVVFEFVPRAIFTLIKRQNFWRLTSLELCSLVRSEVDPLYLRLFKASPFLASFFAGLRPVFVRGLVWPLRPLHPAGHSPHFMSFRILAWTIEMCWDRWIVPGVL